MSSRSSILPPLVIVFLTTVVAMALFSPMAPAGSDSFLAAAAPDNAPVLPTRPPVPTRPSMATVLPLTPSATATPPATSTPPATATPPASTTPTATATLPATGTAGSTATATPRATPNAATATANSVATATANAVAAADSATATVNAIATADAATATAYASIPTYTPTATSAAPANDDFGSAVQIGSFPYDTSEDTAGATVADDDPSMGAGAGQNSATVWYSFTVSQGGHLDVNTTDSSYDTVLAAFTGSRGSLSLVVSNDDVSNSIRQSEIAFDVQADTTYYLEVAAYGSGGGGQLQLAASFTGGTVGTATATPTPTVGFPITSTPQMLGATAPTPDATAGVIPPFPATTDPRYFQQTGYRISNDAFWDYFQKRGGVRTFGYPISREFTLTGFRVQLLQRGLLQQMPNGSVSTMNLLDSGLMPYTRINGSTFPGQDPEMIQSAPLADDPAYAEKAIAFVQSNVPDQWEGQSVNFLQTFLSTVRYEDAFPQGGADPALVPLLNLEFWGLPTSRPTSDPHNHNFIYQRFQRGIMHYDATAGVTQGLLLGDYFKSIITGQDLPPDLAQQASLSFFYRQYDRSKPGYLARPIDLRGTELVGAFEMDLPQ